MTTALRRFREERGLSQPDLARVLGVSQSSIVNYEHGRTWPASITAQQRMRRLFGVGLDVLLAPDNDNGADPEADPVEDPRERTTNSKGSNHRVSVGG